MPWPTELTGTHPRARSAPHVAVISDWVKRTAERKASAEFDPAGNSWQHHFASVDVTGNSASVKIELSKGGKLVYTDYLSLLKFDSGWRIVAKVYHRHGD